MNHRHYGKIESMQPKTITVLGAGYVGLTSATLFAHAGYTVYLIEPNPERLSIIKSGRSFFYEPGIDVLVGQAIEHGTLIPTDSYEVAIPNSSIVFSCVGTPDNPDGSSNLTYVFDAARQTLQYARNGLVYVQKSTVPVGTGRKIEVLFNESAVTIDYVSNPEFLREGSAVHDTLFFDRVVVGGDSQTASTGVIDVYRDLEKVRDHIAHLAGVPTGSRGDQYITTSLNSAELIKVTSNAFLALKLSFANSIAVLADKADADVVEVLEAVGADHRIGSAFLKAGRGYGGGCFPKDVSGLIASGLDYGVDLEIMQATKAQNDQMPGYIVDRLQDLLPGGLTGKSIAVLGLAFKANTSDARRSPGIAIANSLIEAGAKVKAYDPKAVDEAKHDLHSLVQIGASIDDTIDQVDAILITTEWKDFLDYPASEFRRKMKGTILYDTVNHYDRIDAAAAGLTYLGIGRSQATTS